MFFLPKFFCAYEYSYILAYIFLCLFGCTIARFAIFELKEILSVVKLDSRKLDLLNFREKQFFSKRNKVRKLYLNTMIYLQKDKKIDFGYVFKSVIDEPCKNISLWIWFMFFFILEYIGANKCTDGANTDAANGGKHVPWCNIGLFM